MIDTDRLESHQRAWDKWEVENNRIDEEATWLCKHGPRGCDDCWGDEWMEKHYEEKERNGDTGQALQCECQIEAGERQGLGDRAYIIPSIEMGRKKQ